MIRDPKLWILLVVSMPLAFVVYVLLLNATREPEVDPRGTAATMTPAAYNTGSPIQGDTLCLEDRTHGFPVEQAARAYEGVVEIVVTDDCTGYESRVWVVTVIRDEGWSGWYNGPGDQRDGAALISLNAGQAFRHTPTSWRGVLVHEIGHALGLEHTHEVPSVMDPVHGALQPGLTEYDREQLAQLYP